MRAGSSESHRRVRAIASVGADGLGTPLPEARARVTLRSRRLRQRGTDAGETPGIVPDDIRRDEGFRFAECFEDARSHAQGFPQVAIYRRSANAIDQDGLDILAFHEGRPFDSTAADGPLLVLLLSHVDVIDRSRLMRRPLDPCA